MWMFLSYERYAQDGRAEQSVRRRHFLGEKLRWARMVISQLRSAKNNVQLRRMSRDVR